MYIRATNATLVKKKKLLEGAMIIYNQVGKHFWLTVYGACNILFQTSIHNHVYEKLPIQKCISLEWTF